MNKDFVFRGFVASLVATGSIGAGVFLFLPSWSTLVAEVGVKGAWGVLVIFHFVYTVLIGIATLVFLKVIEKFKYQGSVVGAGLSAAVTVTIINVVSSGESINFGGFFVFSLWLVLLTWVVNFVVFLSIKLLYHRLHPTQE